MSVEVLNGTLSEEEIAAYEKHIQDQYKNRKIEELRIELDGEFVNLSYRLAPVSFERIRRITGYLVGTLDRFNDAKRAEEQDRIKHGLC